MKQIIIEINVSETNAQRVLNEISRFTYAISSACGSITQKVKEV
jgi:hypothetical protein